MSIRIANRDDVIRALKEEGIQEPNTALRIVLETAVTETGLRCRNCRRVRGWAPPYYCRSCGSEKGQIVPLDELDQPVEGALFR